MQPGDFITLDFEGSIAGKPFQGGKGENYFFEVGGGQALPQFEESVIGLTQGVPTKIQVVYPENCSTTSFAGKTVDFSGGGA